MIGQKQLLDSIQALISNSHFPKFCIVWGVKGSGKKCVCREISKMLSYNTVVAPDVKVESIRNIIDNAYTLKSETLYIIPDADNMSLACKNALLKVTEEPPNKAFFIMTLEDINNALPTIRSRATTFQMEPYSKIDITQYAKEDADIAWILELCETPGEVDYLKKVGVDAFRSFVVKVIDNIAVVNGANAFKIASSLCLKENSTGYDFKMFLKTFKILCWNNFLDTKEQKYIIAVQITTDTLKSCYNKSINKQMLFDTWLLAIRGAWIEWT